MTTEQYGDFQDIPSRLNGHVESLDLSFWTSSIPLKQRWRNNGLSADFLGDYVTTFFPLDESDSATKIRQAEIRSAVSYIANELLENAMKFSADSAGIPVSMRMYLLGNQIMLMESNGANIEQAAKLQTFIQQILSEDPYELYFRKMEEKATASAESGSGLGLLTMINDYGAKLAWRLESVENAVYVSTQVNLVI